MATFDDPEILRGVLEDLPSGVYLVGRDGKILFWNYGAERITGHLRQDVAGHACREDFLGTTEGNDGEVTAASAALEAVLRDGKPTESQVSFRHKAGPGCGAAAGSADEGWAGQHHRRCGMSR